MIRSRKNSKNIKGQSLLETVIAIGFVMIIVVGSISMGVYTLQIGSSSQDRLTAINLAREGIEVIRNIRDSNWLNGDSWDTTISDNLGTMVMNFNPTLTTGTWTISDAGGDIDTCDTTCQLYLNPIYGVYNHDNTGMPTNFYRGVEISLSGGKLTVISRVRWIEKNKSYYVTLEEHLTDWRYD
ncbi:MAG: hypothetical protein O2U61_07630 [Candidatus Bathyarchaeota archaeon]|nr:hypothetical protein [Candidatus Bathyarchaeota archaeon]